MTTSRVESLSGGLNLGVQILDQLARESISFIGTIEHDATNAATAIDFQDLLDHC